jgi:hypothetical protein
MMHPEWRRTARQGGGEQRQRAREFFRRSQAAAACEHIGNNSGLRWSASRHFINKISYSLSSERIDGSDTSFMYFSFQERWSRVIAHVLHTAYRLNSRRRRLAFRYRGPRLERRLKKRQVSKYRLHEVCACAKMPKTSAGNEWRYCLQ